jgi:subtilisin family serine protease
MENEKLEDQLNLALQIPSEQLLENDELQAGFDAKANTWELVVRFAGSSKQFVETVEKYGGRADVLLVQYAVVVLSAGSIALFSKEPNVIFIEKAKNMQAFLTEGKKASCPFSVIGRNKLTGKGVFVGIIDSGIDLFHPEFIRENGESAIAAIWDQANERYYDKEEIQKAVNEKQTLITDPTGHGTHVASIAAGNSGMAPSAEILFVKLARSQEGELSRTTNLMRGVDVLVQKAEEEKKPLALNISYGTNYGDHRGNSLLESYLNDVSRLWQISICVGMGNEGAAGRHRQGTLKNSATEIIEYSVAPYETYLNLQIWKEYTDEFQIVLLAPSGVEQQITGQAGFGQRNFGQTRLSYFYGMPSPYNRSQEIFLAFSSEKGMIESGIWTLFFIPQKIKNGRYAMWLPVSENNSANTRFQKPSLALTLTIPAAAKSVISVGAYDAKRMQYAPFSGRGDEDGCVKKPDLAAPGVDILAAAPGGGMTRRSGTSMAVPFVTGAAALFMEWGIVQGNQPYLYGETMKAYLMKGAKELPGIKEYPNEEVGYGTLCVKNSIPV